MQIYNILDGWKNFISKSEVSEELAKQRAEHCLNCVELKKGGITAFINDDFKEIEGYYCNNCKCPLSAKLRSKKEKCPLKKW